MQIVVVVVVPDNPGIRSKFAKEDKFKNLTKAKISESKKFLF